MFLRVFRTWSAAIALVLVAGFTFIGCPAKKEQPKPLDVQALPPYLNISSTIPNDLPRTATLEQVAQFAWQEFLALNWKASIDSTHPPSATNQRGNPDPGWNYTMAAPASPDPLVWQTFAQTTELRPNGPLTTPWASLGIPVYSYFTPPVQGTPTSVNNLWNNLDEDNEIGSCDIYARYSTQPAPKELVLFQVRVNQDEYEYLRLNYGPDQNCAPPGTQGAMNYPNCNPAAGGKLAGAQAAVVTNITKPGFLYYPGQTSTCNCPPDQAICLPCGKAGGAVGTIEVKTGWRRLLPGDTASHFFTATSVYYDKNEKGELAYYNDTFALVAMHIIHKTENFPDYVFATFEQVEVEQSLSQFITLNNGVETGAATPIARQTTQTNREELHPVPTDLDTVTDAVHKQLMALNPSTVWQYYRLTGVQGASIDCPVTLPAGTPATTQNCVQYQDATQCTTLNPNYYMANFMVESDPFLNNFSGPGFGNKGNAIFTGNCQNTVYNAQIFNNGGCKGCHGVAQTAFGTDFSFLLDFGNNKPSIVPAALHYTVPSGDLKQASLKKFMAALKQQP